MKRTPLRKKGKAKISTLNRKLWKLVSEYIKTKYGNTCYTCDRQHLEKQNFHCGHFIPKAACNFQMKYDERNLRPQCYHCNINLGGNGAEFSRRLRAEFGDEYVEQIHKDNQSTGKAGVYEVEQRIEEFKELLKTVEN